MVTAPAPVVMIRPATAADLDRLVEMARHFLQQTVYGTRITEDGDHLRHLGTRLLTDGIVLVAETDAGVVGMLLGTVYDHFLVHRRLASEVAWWVEPTARRRGVAQALLAAFEAAARAHGATQMQLGSWNDTLDRFYLRLGYAPAERTFTKDLLP